MKKKIFLAVFLCCGMFAAMAQTAADSLANRFCRLAD